MALNNTAKNLMLEELASNVTYLSLHSAYPAVHGTNEISGGSPAYARKAITWNTASGGAIDSSNQPEFDVPAVTVAAVGLYDAATAGNLLGDYDVTDEVFAAQGTYTITDADIDLNG